MAAPVTTSHPAAVAVEDRMFRALLWLRLIVLGNVLVLNWYRRDNFVHETAGWLVLAGLAAWTLLVVRAYSDRRHRVPMLLVADLGVAVAGILVSPEIKGDGLSATIPGFWVMGVVLAWGAHWRWLGGLVAASVVSLADLYIRLPDVSQTNYANVFLLMLGGPMVGYLCGSLQKMAAERDEAERAVATAQERARLARAVHDGVLQVLALVQRRGAEIGGETAELARLAGEQETALRALIREQEAVSAPGDATVDLAVALDRLSTRRTPQVSVAMPGQSVRLPAHVTAELVDAVSACLDNVAVHVGDDAPAWVLLEDLGDRVVVTVRDEGPGIPEGRLEQAASDGRLGVSESIRGRVEDLGGTAELTTGSFGTEWEFTVPR
jgi:signal transduction histidine kinase